MMMDPSWRGFWHWVWKHNEACIINRFIAPSGRYIDMWECKPKEAHVG